MDDAMKSRAIINNIPDTKVSFNDMVIKACAMALKRHQMEGRSNYNQPSC
jgi:pyruvate dehydrogenase E2 component (dihydrolipoamide acetyltransferase)